MAEKKLSQKQLAFLHAHGVLGASKNHTIENMGWQKHILAAQAHDKEAAMLNMASKKNPATVAKIDWHQAQAKMHRAVAAPLDPYAAKPHGEVPQASHTGNVELKNHEHFEGSATTLKQEPKITSSYGATSGSEAVVAVGASGEHVRLPMIGSPSYSARPSLESMMIPKDVTHYLVQSHEGKMLPERHANIQSARQHATGLYSARMYPVAKKKEPPEDQPNILQGKSRYFG